MARTRTVKPEFWTDRRIGECSTTARLLFVAALNFADDEGGLDRSAKQLKAQAFPYDNINCEPLIQELLSAGLMLEYESGGEKYLHIKNFRKHQRIDKPQPARIPVYDSSKEIPRTIQERSETIQPSKGMEGNGMEGNGSRESRRLARPRTRKVPESFQVTDAMREWAARETPDSDVDRETALFRDHEYKDPHGDWPAAWRKWMRRAPEFHGRGVQAAEPKLTWRPPADDPEYGAPDDVPN